MKKILYIATLGKKSYRLDGETIKGQILEKYLSKQEDIKILTIDTDDWKKHVFKLIFLILFNYFKCNKIVISSYDFGAHIILDFFQKIKSKKAIYYFVIGSTLSQNIKEKNWNLKIYENVKEIYVEATSLKKGLNELGLNNIVLLNNFREIKKFENQYFADKVAKFVFFARVIKDKGVEDAIEIVEKLNENNIPAILDIYGQAEEEYIYELRTKFNDRIKYHGALVPNGKKEYEILSKYDALLFPTHYYNEGLPGTVIDAYISALPVISSRWKNAPEYIEDGFNGLLYEFENNIDFYDKTKNFILSYDKKEMKKNAKDSALKFSVDIVLADFIKKVKE